MYICTVFVGFELNRSDLEAIGATEGEALRAHAKLTSLVATARVPKITIVIGNSYPPFSYALVCFSVSDLS